MVFKIEKLRVKCIFRIVMPSKAKYLAGVNNMPPFPLERSITGQEMFEKRSALNGQKITEKPFEC